jgi:hypothetical protein
VWAIEIPTEIDNAISIRQGAAYGCADVSYPLCVPL